MIMLGSVTHSAVKWCVFNQQESCNTVPTASVILVTAPLSPEDLIDAVLSIYKMQAHQETSAVTPNIHLWSE